MTRWLRRARFLELTGVRQDRVRFCLKRPEKREHCLASGATHFVDDHLDVLQHLVGVVPHLYWFGFQPAGNTPPPWAKQTLDWVETRRAILSQLAEPRSGSAPIWNLSAAHVAHVAHAEFQGIRAGSAGAGCATVGVKASSAAGWGSLAFLALFLRLRRKGVALG